MPAPTQPPHAPSPGTGAAPAAPPLKAQDYAALRDWPNYFRAVAGKPARQTLLDALTLFDADKPDAGAAAARTALDLGCGEGRDTAELLARGWNVHAVDAEADAFAHLGRRAAGAGPGSLTPVIGSFFDPALPWPESPSLINASYSLPFCPPEHFGAMWDRIVRTLPRGGRFAGQLFGDRDGWSGCVDMTFLPRRTLDALFDAFLFESVREVENEEPNAFGDMKSWHLYHIVARKR